MMSAATVTALSAEQQNTLLVGVSRTFALTIPQLPDSLRGVVANAYLLCRLVDTIEDEPALSLDQKRDYCSRFAAAVGDREDPVALAAQITPLLSDSTLPAERELMRQMPRVLAITRGYRPAQQLAIERCVRIMAEGMAQFQATAGLAGLSDQPALDRYCYYVAGVVGEMLTELFCDHSPEIARQRETLMRLAVSFGQGLQMTNILKDIWEDRSRGVCWLPRTTFAPTGVDLGDLENARKDAIGAGLEELIGVAHRHLRDALDYTLAIPRQEAGIRNFCLWAIGMAVLTLRRINEHRDFRAGDEVKISRRSVRLTVAALRLTATRDSALKLLFGLAARGLPPPRPQIRDSFSTLS
ncbi:phytoene/squalene synthase family protein [Acidihalobacter ferrooxydans]|uniref:Phytoene synthase n=1 Tax=Acidihalobacter ferrooxydans TaxID=1765967 RepID=A0A1P8UF55_9GAMM|nr:phytoene/squalene synthase family protein [Acidihalobacter ferrooxydans]APZ42477.1 phytoene synthase [Acidihalobacter ferrooxydans]